MNPSVPRKTIRVTVTLVALLLLCESYLFLASFHATFYRFTDAKLQSASEHNSYWPSLQSAVYSSIVDQVACAYGMEFYGTSERLGTSFTKFPLAVRAHNELVYIAGMFSTLNLELSQGPSCDLDTNQVQLH